MYSVRQIQIRTIFFAAQISSLEIFRKDLESKSKTKFNGSNLFKDFHTVHCNCPILSNSKGLNARGYAVRKYCSHRHID